MKKKIATELVSSGCYVKAKDIDKKEIVTSTNDTVIAYLSCRLAISNVELRKMLIEKLSQVVNSEYGSNITLVGMATAGIPWATGIAEKLDIPMIYLRSSDKKYGLGGCIEGNIKDIPKDVVIVDDVFCTGSTVNYGKEKLEENGLSVLGGIFIANLSDKNKKEYNDVKLNYLTTYKEIINEAKKQKIINDQEYSIMKKVYKRY